MQPQLAAALLKSRALRRTLGILFALALAAPVLAASAISGLIAQHEEETCGGPGSGTLAPAGSALSSGWYAAPLPPVPGHWYEVGATEYGGPTDPASGSYGSIPAAGESYLPAHPDSYAELSVLAANPANGGSFTFADANALGNLPYLAGLRVEHAGRRLLLLKRDIGYGQGPGQRIANGEPYRLDLWWQAAQALGVSKDAVRIQLTPPTGSGNVLQALPETTGPGEHTQEAGCPGEGSGSVPLPLAPGSRTRILASGLAAAATQTPAAVQAMVAAGNRLNSAGYLYGGAHGSSLGTLQPAYDCSSAVSYLLHSGGMLGSASLDSTALESYGQPGPGRWISIYANAAHTFIYVAGLRFDTVFDAAYDSGPNSGRAGPRWRVSASVPAWATWTVRHPSGL